MEVMLYTDFIVFFWLIFVATWALSAIGVKRDITKNRPWWQWFFVRVLFIVALIWLLNLPSFSGFWISANSSPFFANMAVQLIGVILAGAGIAFAIWARFNLGRNWSGSPQMKENHELVTSGPYRYVRHPIYTGMTTALFGSALVGGPAWLITFIVFLIIFILRIPKEEGYMMKLFPDQYPAYRARTKALIPGVW